MAELTGMVGFASPNSEKNLSRQRTLKIELIATAALAVSLVIAATAVSIGAARAHVLATMRHGNTAPVAVTVLLDAAPAGGVTIMAARWPRSGATELDPRSD
jgi:hypothetical protein